MLRVLLSCSLLVLSACGAAAGTVPPAAGEPDPARPAAEAGGEEPEPAPQPEPTEASGEEAEEADGAPSPAAGEGGKGGDIPLIVQAGTMPRDSLVEVLDRGVARFLQNVDTRPLKARGHFVGWKLLAFFPGDERFAGGAVRAGDTVLRVNGRSIERPESFKTVWDSLYTARELKVLLLREGRVYELRYAIEHGAAPDAGEGKP